MTTRPWMPWYIAAFVGDTQHLDAAETGAYMLLLGHYWMNGALPDGDAAMARVSRMTAAQWKRSRETLLKFFPDGHNKRADIELAKAAEISSKRSASAKQKHSISSANAEQLDTHARASSQTQEQRKEDTANAVPSSYAFESGIIRLSEKHFNQWKAHFTHLDLGAELIGMTEWASQQGPRWFFAVSQLLAKRNREVAERLERERSPDLLTPDEKFYGRNGIPGVI